MKHILINDHLIGTKVCVVENGELVEFWVERRNQNKLVGNIYKGKVVNVLKGMQAAFVDIGLERNAFLFSGDTLVDASELADGMVEERKLKLKAGDSVLCQVVKDEFGTKGARITMNISLPGRVVVMMPNLDYVGVSKKIVCEEKRKELADYVESIKPNGYGFILRTEAEHSSLEEIKLEMEELVDKYKKIKKDYLYAEPYSLVYKEEELIERSVRDMLRGDVDRVIVDNESVYDRLKDAFPFLTDKNPDLFELYTGNENIISFYGLDTQIDKLLKRKVVLKNGAYIIIDRTEALTVIDVNTGKYVGDKNLEETVFKTNMIATEEIAKQLRLRNIGGIIVVDFIDMDNEEHRQKVLEALSTHLKKDRIKTTVMGMTHLGLVELTRKKTRSMLESVMLQTCPYCNGDAYVYSDDHVIVKIRDALVELFNTADPPAARLTVNPQVFSKMFALRYLAKECATDWKGKRIYVIADQMMHIEKFKLDPERNMILSLPDSAKLLY